MFQWLRKPSAPPPAARITQRSIPARVRARYDSAETTEENRKHWAHADYFAADFANLPMVRRTLRARARYEVANNSYAKGIVLTLANDCVGTGPRLQMLTDKKDVNEQIDMAFARWAKAVDLALKLRTMRQSKAVDGEAFGMFITNDRLDAPVKLDVRLIEADQIATPLPGLNPWLPTMVDGIVLDAKQIPVSYHVLKFHPGSFFNTMILAYDTVPAERVVHLYRMDRPGQHRGVPELTPALALFAQLRRYTLAVLAAAETAADFAAVIQTDAPAGGDAEDVEPYDLVELERRMATVLPGGWKLGQMNAEQPATTYGEFKKEILNEIARCLNVPFNVAAGNSSGYNYSSGRLDHQTYFKSIRVEQSEMAHIALDPLLRAFLTEAILVRGLLPPQTRAMIAAGELPHQWYWDGMEHVDPAKEATAQATRLTSNTTTLAYEFARQGKNWEVELRQRAKEVALQKELGLWVPPPPQNLGEGTSPAPAPAVDKGSDETDQATEPVDEE